MSAADDIRASQALEQGFQLGDLKIDPAAGEVSGPGGREQLDAKVMAVLVFLARHAGQVVLREDLLARLWPNQVVTDDAVSRCIYELRRQLSHAGGHERYKAMLETLPKRGYRLNGEIELTPSQPGNRQRIWSNRRFLALAIVIPAALLLWFTAGRQLTERPVQPRSPPAAAVANSIAVLPFVDMSEGQDQQYLSDGITEEILDRLARSGRLRVIARTSSFAFRGQPLDIPQIAAKLNVSHVLEGSVRRSGDRVRITAQLVDTSSNSHIWSESYDHALGDLFAVQDEIAASVAEALQVTLAGRARHRPPPASAGAYERFLQGEFFYNRRAPGDIERSVKYFEQAIAIDPDYARAWAALAGAYSLLAWDGGPSAQVRRARQGVAARKAVELDPNLAVAHARLAQYYSETSDRNRAHEHYRKAVALDPDDSLVLGFAGGLHEQGHTVEEVVARQRRLVARDPLAVSHRVNFGLMLTAAGRLDEAMSEFHKVLELNPDVGWEVKLEIPRILVLQLRYDEAYAAISRMPEGKFRDQGLALLYQAPGRRAEADAALQRLSARPRDQGDIRLAEVYAFRGMHEEAFASLQQARKALERDEASAMSRIWGLNEDMALSPFLAPLHGDPRWAALMADAADGAGS